MMDTSEMGYQVAAMSTLMERRMQDIWAARCALFLVQIISHFDARYKLLIRRRERLTC